MAIALCAQFAGKVLVEESLKRRVFLVEALDEPSQKYSETRFFTKES